MMPTGWAKRTGATYKAQEQFYFVPQSANRRSFALANTGQFEWPVTLYN